MWKPLVHPQNPQEFSKLFASMKKMIQQCLKMNLALKKKSFLDILEFLATCLMK